MKIAVFHELSVGGARRVVNDFSGELKKRHIVDAYIVDEREILLEKKFFSKVNLYKFVPKKWSGKNWKAKLYKDSIELYKLYKLHKKIAKTIDKKKYDIVIIHPSKFTQAPFILRFITTTNIYYAHEVYRIIYDPYFMFKGSSNIAKNMYEKYSRYIKKTIDRSNVKSAYRIIVNSKNTKNNFAKFYSKASTVCYPGVNTEFFSPSLQEKDIDILFVGSTEDNRDGFFDLKKAINSVHRKLRVEIVGDGKIWIDDKKFRRYYRRAKIVFCGAHNEPFGLVPLEAISCGSEVIAISQGGYIETGISDATVFTQRSYHKIASAILKSLRVKATKTSGRQKIKIIWDIKKRSKELEYAIMDIIDKSTISNKNRMEQFKLFSNFFKRII